MARRTDGEKIDELEKLVARILLELEHVNKTLDALTKDSVDTSKILNDFQQLHERQYTALAKETDEYRRWSEKNGTAEVKGDLTLLKEKTNKLELTHERIGNRAWSVVPSVVGSVVNVVLAAIVAYIVARTTR